MNDDVARIEEVQPSHFAKPKGYANGIIARGRTLHVAGQIGWRPDGRFETDDFVGQFAQALDNVLDVVRAAGGKATDVVKMTVYVTDLDAYRESRAVLGEVWRTRMGRHYPAMALLQVAGLLEPRALVEIEAVACLPEEP